MSGTWEWGWNNPTVNAERRRDAYSIRASGFSRRFEALTTGVIRVTVDEARSLLVAGGAIVGADSVILAFASGRYSMALAVRNIAMDDSAKPHPVRANPAPTKPLGLAAFLPRHLRDPIILKRMEARPAGVNRAAIDDLEDAAIPAVLRDYLRKSERALIAGGFRAPLYTRTLEERNTTSCAALFEHPDDFALGYTLVNVPKSGNVTAVTAFATYFADGWKVSTSNSPTVLRTPSRPRVDGARFKQMLDTRALYEIHRARVRARARHVDIVPMTRGADPIAFLEKETRESHAFWIEKRYYRAVDGDRIRLTTLGAVLSAWRTLFPWKHVTEWKMDRKSAAILRRLRVTATSQTERS